MEREISIDTEVNEKQRDAIESTDGPLLIIAGPGSGKTFTLVERIFYLINHEHVSPENLLVATFTEKAAQELMTRISNKLLSTGIKFNINEMYIGTIHSICLRLLEEHRDLTRLKRNYTLMDQFDQQYFIYQRLREYDQIENIDILIGDPEKTSRWSRSETLLKWINKVSEEAIDTDKLLISSEPGIKALGDSYFLYQEQLATGNALDFSTIQLETLRLLEDHSEVTVSLQSQICYLMIDEYQDTNTIQELILLKLAGKNANICVVGDDDQGLYRFRGASIRNILEFPANFPPGVCKQVDLTVNYRSHPGIIDFYNDWMQQADWKYGGKTFRFSKTIEPREDEFPSMPAVLRVSGRDDYDNWHEEVLEFLQTLKSSDVLSDWNQVAFLFKSVRNTRVIGLANFLENKGIPIYSPRSNMFFQREEVRLMIGALIFLFPQYPQIRQWAPDIHMYIWDYYDSCFRNFGEMLRKPENKQLLLWCRKRAKEHLVLASNADYSFSGLFYELLQFPLFSNYLGDEADGCVLDSRPAHNLAIFSKLLTKFEYLHHIIVLTPKYLEKNITDLFNQFLRYLSEGGINEFEDMMEYAPSGCVPFMTIHQSKGLEFPIVVVGSMENVPRKQYTEIDELLQDGFYRKPPFEPLDRTKFYDFWRLFYTAFSRAQNLLVLSCQEHTPCKRGDKRVPSRYFAEIYQSSITWRDKSFELSKLTLETIKDINIKKVYSFTSHITLFENCALQYRFFKDLGFIPVRQSPILFGTLVHQTIEDVHKTVLRGEAEKVTEQQVEVWFNDNYIHLSHKEGVYLAPQILAVALDQVNSYVKHQAYDWSIIQQAEVDVSLVKDKYILRGVIDLIRGKEGTVEIVDFKSEKKPDLEKEKDRVERYRRQLEIYAHLVEERENVKVSQMHLYYTSEKNGNPYVTFKKDSQVIDKTIAAIDSVVDRIENKEYFIKDRPAKQCENCDIRHYCNAK